MNRPIATMTIRESLDKGELLLWLATFDDIEFEVKDGRNLFDRLLRRRCWKVRVTGAGLRAVAASALEIWGGE